MINLRGIGGDDEPVRLCKFFTDSHAVCVGPEGVQIIRVFEDRSTEVLINVDPQGVTILVDFLRNLGIEGRES